MEICDYTVPFADHNLREDSPLTCLREARHEGEHLVLSITAKFVAWDYEKCPDCQHPDCEELMECYVQGLVSLVSVWKMLCWGVDCPPAKS